jgi:hypothetical protein
MEINRHYNKPLWESKVIGPKADKELRWRLFAVIEDAKDWKLPIDRWVSKEYFGDLNQACVWFVGGELTIAEERSSEVRVTSPGYYELTGA